MGMKEQLEVRSSKANKDVKLTRKAR